jgi:hypothetical protein
MSDIPVPVKSPFADIFDLLTKRGWMGKVDWFLIVSNLVWPIVAHFWLAWQLVPMLLVSVLLLLCWLVILAYRIAYFVIMIQVALDAMPATSARLAVRFLKNVPSNLAPGA